MPTAAHQSITLPQTATATPAQVAFNRDGLLPVVAQSADTGAVLMLAWMNAEALQITLETGRVTYYSRSRQSLWEKGETSGNRQQLVSAHLDCDGDTLLLRVKQSGPACHLGNDTCFARRLKAKAAD